MAVTGGKGPSKPVDAKITNPVPAGAGAGVYDGEFSISSPQAIKNIRERIQDGSPSHGDSVIVAREKNQAIQKQEAEQEARDRSFTYLVSALTLNDVINNALQDFDKMSEAAEDEIEDHEEDIEDLAAKVRSLDIEISGIRTMLESDGKPLLTLDDIPGIDKEALGIDMDGNRLVYGDKAGGFYILDENGTRHMITGENAAKISDYMDHHKNTKTGSAINSTDAKYLNDRFITREKAQEEARLHEAEEFFQINVRQPLIADAKQKIQLIKDSDLSEADKKRLIHQVWEDTKSTIAAERAKHGLPEQHHHRERQNKHRHQDSESDSTQSSDNAAPAPAPAPSTSQQALDANRAGLAAAIVSGEISHSELEQIAAEIGISPRHLQELDAALSRDYYANLTINPPGEDESSFNADDVTHEVGSFVAGIEQTAFNPVSVDTLTEDVAMTIGPSAPALAVAAKPAASPGRKA